MRRVPIRRGWRVLATVGLGLSLILPSQFLGSPATAVPAVTAAPAGGSVPSRGRYLSLGDSLAAGYQPAHDGQAAGDDPTGGYTGVVNAGLSERGQPMRTTNLACSGETARTMIAGGQCTYPEGSQLAAARSFLRRHHDTRLITVTIGANDVRACLAGNGIDIACAERELDAVGRNLEVILATVHRAAPRARLVVLDYYNPYLAARLNGPDGRQLAIAASKVQTRLNTLIRRAAADRGARTARVAAAFDSRDVRQVELPGVGEVPRNVARICTWTWMCSVHDIHANAAGYDIMGKAVLNRLDDTR
ncbi:MAG: GDSL-type esterase/lipase family protein [Micrococcales bacterium]|nr:GDSL-type esterase/lipase family protein [Micrococcales bacterium]